MSNEIENNNEELECEPKVYELGYLLSPVVESSEVKRVVDEQIGKVITEAGGKILDQTTPELRSLAYAVGITREHKRQDFNQAYFGSVRFEADPGLIADIETKLKNNQTILRYLLTVVPKKVLRAAQEAASGKTDKKSETVSEKEVGVTQAEVSSEPRETSVESSGATKEEVSDESTAGQPQADSLDEEVIDREIEGLLNSNT